MMPDGLVLSVFPGIDLLGRAFEEEGYCVVRGPDVIWGGDIRGWHPPAGVFEGVIGGPPCQAFSRLRHLIRHNGYEPRFGDLIPEFKRVVEEAKPRWFLMENVPDAPVPEVQDYYTYWFYLSDRQVGGTQPRKRRFSFGTFECLMLHIPHHEGRGDDASLLPRSVTVSHSGRRPKRQDKSPPPPGGVVDIATACEAMGLPRDFTEHMPFTMQGKRSVIGNGVPMAMGRAVAKAVRRVTCPSS